MRDYDTFRFLSEKSSGVLEFGAVRMALLDIESGFWSIRRQVEALIGFQLTNSVFQQAGANGGASFAKSFGTPKSTTEEQQFFENCLQAYQTAGFGHFNIVDSHWQEGKVLVRGQNTFEAWMMQRHDQQADVQVCAYTAGVLVGFVNIIGERQDIVCIEHQCQAKGDPFCEFELLPVAEAEHQSVVSITPDPMLGRQINLLEMLFERMPMGIAVIDRDFNLVRCNPTWAAFIDQYTPSEAVQVLPGAYLFDLEPGTEDVIIPLFEQVFKGETIHQDAVRIESGGIVSFWDIVLSPLYENEQVVGLLNVSIDVTERVKIYQTLEQRVTERTHEVERRREIAESLRDIIGMINANMPLDTFLEKAVRLATQRVGAAACVLHHFDLEAEEIEHMASYGMAGMFPKRGRRHFSALKVSGGEMYLLATLKRKPTYTNYPPLPERVDEIKRDTTIPDEIKTERIALRSAFAGSLSVPLFIQDAVYGGMVFYYKVAQEFTDEQIQLALTFAEQVSLAIENAHLREKVEQTAVTTERNRLARDLHDAVSQTLFSASLIADVLPKLWDRDPELGKEKLDELRQLTRGALSEMRTLLLELRPASLVDIDLVDLLQHLVNAFTGRTRVPVNLVADGQVDPAPEIKEVFFRVAQEALNNISKHAGATQVTVNLARDEKKMLLEIRDDGIGFHPEDVTAESLGLGIMRERADAIHAELEIKSEPTQGTYIKLFWEAARK
ncbi:MAG: GAF domain-containing protein [Chloroflexi bacterium]|jgi:signal transduction histidine kinase/predicted hydrocarbon binding protein|nr:GAF domain-containing protein [Chloroflexota bacterium]